MSLIIFNGPCSCTNQVSCATCAFIIERNTLSVVFSELVNCACPTIASPGLFADQDLNIGIGFPLIATYPDEATSFYANSTLTVDGLYNPYYPYEEGASCSGSLVGCTATLRVSVNCNVEYNYLTNTYTTGITVGAVLTAIEYNYPSGGNLGYYSPVFDGSTLITCCGSGSEVITNTSYGCNDTDPPPGATGGACTVSF